MADRDEGRTGDFGIVITQSVLGDRTIPFRGVIAEDSSSRIQTKEATLTQIVSRKWFPRSTAEVLLRSDIGHHSSSFNNVNVLRTLTKHKRNRGGEVEGTNLCRHQENTGGWVKSEVLV